MTAIVTGIYKQGTVELLEQPNGLREGRVRVVLTEERTASGRPCYLTFGKYRDGPQATLEDFQHAEWHGEAEFEESNGP